MKTSANPAAQPSGSNCSRGCEDSWLCRCRSQRPHDLSSDRHPVSAETHAREPPRAGTQTAHLNPPQTQRPISPAPARPLLRLNGTIEFTQFVGIDCCRRIVDRRDIFDRILDRQVLRLICRSASACWAIGNRPFDFRGSLGSSMTFSVSRAFAAQFEFSGFTTKPLSNLG